MTEKTDTRDGRLLALAESAAAALATLHNTAVKDKDFNGLLDHAYDLSDLAEDVEKIARAGQAGGQELALTVMGLIKAGADVDVTILELGIDGLDGVIIGVDGRAA